MIVEDTVTMNIVRKGGKLGLIGFIFFVLLNLIVLFGCYRGRSPQPPAEEEEEDIDDKLVVIDTCEYN